MRRVLPVAALMLAGPALAQSSVTLYGIVDAYGQVLDGRSSVARIGSGGLSSSRFGFRGSEDLGGGLRAVFTLESGLNVDDGTISQGGVFFGRQAFVGLESDWGRLTAGRQYSSTYYATLDYSIFGNQTVGPSTAVIGGFAGYEPVRGAAPGALPPATGATGSGSPARINNSLRYESPSWNGLKASVLYGAGEVAGGTSDSRVFDLGLRYASSGFDVMLSYLDDRARGATSATSTDASTTTLAGSYTFAPLRFVAGILDFDDKRSENQDGRAFWLGADYRLGKHLLKAQFIENRPRYGSDNKTRAFGVGWVYEMSKRSQLYSSLTRFDNDDGAGAGLGRTNSAVPVGLTSSGDNSVSEFAFGIRHAF